MRKKILVKGPLLSQSGYGEQARFALRSLHRYENIFDLYVHNLNWGQTSWLWEDEEERNWIDRLILKTFEYMQSGNARFDVSLQVTIPNEWEKIAPINIGYTAGIETTRVAPGWIEKSKIMDKIIVPSEHSKYVYESTYYKIDGTDENIGVDCEIDVVNFPHKQSDPSPVDLNLEYDFNFLTVAQWSPRKNLENTIKWFVEEFIDQEVGLVVKCNSANNSYIDYSYTKERIEFLLNGEQYKNRKCKVHLLHGYLKQEEMHALYQHPRIKALLSLSHGEGFGLPLFEAAGLGLPIVTTEWSGPCDFLKLPVKRKSGKVKNKSAFAKVLYDVRPIQKSAVWKGVLEKDSMWAFPQEGSSKMKMREIVKNYDSYKKTAEDLACHLRENWSFEGQSTKFCKSIAGDVIFQEPKYVFVSDFFVNEVAGGAELSLQTLIDSCPTDSALVKSQEISAEIIKKWSKSKWVFGNISRMNLELVSCLAQEDVDYSFVEFDYKLCKHRNPVLYRSVEGTDCDYPSSDLALKIKDFMAGAKSVFFMASEQKDFYLKNFPNLDSSKMFLLSSLFNDNTLDFISQAAKQLADQKTNKWLILNSNSWVKGVANSERWCKENNIDYELVGGLSYKEFLLKLAAAEGVCFKPDGLDTCPRFIIEAKLLGCKLELNENVQHQNEGWFQEGPDIIEKYLRSRKDFFWQKAFV
jgi:glycosyltransferase involved in cell wall biosynthesis